MNIVVKYFQAEDLNKLIGLRVLFDTPSLDNM